MVNRKSITFAIKRRQLKKRHIQIKSDSVIYPNASSQRPTLLVLTKE